MLLAQLKIRDVGRKFESFEPGNGWLVAVKSFPLFPTVIYCNMFPYLYILCCVYSNNIKCTDLDQVPFFDPRD